AVGEPLGRPAIGRVGRYLDVSFGVGAVRGEVVRRQAVKLRLVGYGRAHVVVHRALERQAELGDLVLQRLDPGPRGVVLVHAGETVLEQGVFEIVPGRRVRGRWQRGERPVDRHCAGWRAAAG